MGKSSFTLACLFLVLEGVRISSFSVASTRPKVAPPASILRYHATKCSATATMSPLFSSGLIGSDDPLKRFAALRRRNPSNVIQRLDAKRIAVGRKFRRSAMALLFTTLFWFGAAGVHAPISQASTAPTARIERVLSSTSPSLDKIVDRYVRKHMFDDDTFDPVESAYREAYEDATVGAYPQTLKEITSGTLGQESNGLASRDGSESSGIGALLTSVVGALKKRGLSESAAIVVLAGLFVVAGPCTFLFTGMIIGGMSKRSINRTMKQRYGDTYTVDATMKPEESVEAPEDDDEEDDDDDDEEDSDDVEDEDKKRS